MEALNTHATRTLALIEAAIEGRLPAGEAAYSINGRSITKIPLEELVRLRSLYMAEVARGVQAARAAAGLGTGRNVLVRFR